MHQCKDCQGFVPAKTTICPNCQVQFKATFSQRFKRVMQLILGSSVTMTLAACYGTPPPMPTCDETGKDATTPCRPSPSPSASTSTSSSASPGPAASASPSAAPSSAT